MSDRIIERPVTIDRAAPTTRPLRTLYGERVRVRLPSHVSGGLVSIMDYTAPAGFGPPKHVHHGEHEIFEVLSGRCVAWTPSRSYRLEPGDVVFLPKDSPHTWRAYGGEPLHLTVTVTPGGMESMFEDMSRDGLNPDDLEVMMAIGVRAKADICGPPLSDEEVRTILAETAER